MNLLRQHWRVLKSGFSIHTRRGRRLARAVKFNYKTKDASEKKQKSRTASPQMNIRCCGCREYLAAGWVWAAAAARVYVWMYIFDSISIHYSRARCQARCSGSNDKKARPKLCFWIGASAPPLWLDNRIRLLFNWHVNKPALAFQLHNSPIIMRAPALCIYSFAALKAALARLH